MNDVRHILSSARAALPRDPWACWAAIFFSASALTLLLSVAATQSFLALASVIYFAYLLRAKPAIAFPPIKLPLALFCLWTVISMVKATNPAAGGFEVRKLTLFLIILLTVNLIVSARHLVFLLRVMFLESAVAGIVAIDQFVRQYHRVRIDHPHRIYAYMTIQRIDGFMGHWINFGGQQMLIFCMLFAALLLERRQSRTALASSERAPLTHEIQNRKSKIQNPNWPGWIIMAFLAVSIILNFTRGVWLGCFAGAVYLVARWRARWLWSLPILVAVSLIAGPRLLRRRAESVLHPSRDKSIAIRLQMWRVGWRMIQKHPWVGVGPDNIPEVYFLYFPHGAIPIAGYHAHLHNDYIQFAAERGLPCLAAWLWLMTALGLGILRLGRRLGVLRWIALGAFAAWLAMLVEGCFEFNFSSTPVLMVFLFVISIPFAAGRIEEGENPSQ